MTEYTFTLTLNISNFFLDLDTVIEKLYESGGSDALIGVGNKETIALDFTREAFSYSEAISSAIKDVMKVIPTATLKTEDKVIKNLESNRLTTVEVEIDASEEIDRAIKCWKFINETIQSKFGKTLLSPDIALDTENLNCIEVNLSWETPENILVIRVIEKRYVSAYIYYEDYKEKLQKWYSIEDELPDWFIEKLLLFTEEAQ